MKTEKDCREFLEVITKMLDEMETDNVTGLSETEREEVVTKRNFLEAQKYMLEWFLEEVEED